MFKNCWFQCIGTFLTFNFIVSELYISSMYCWTATCLGYVNISYGVIVQNVPPKSFPLGHYPRFSLWKYQEGICGGEYMVIFKFVGGHTCIALKQQLSGSVSVGGGGTLCMGGHLHSYNSFGDIKQYIYYASSLPHCLS